MLECDIFAEFIVFSIKKLRCMYKLLAPLAFRSHDLFLFWKIGETGWARAYCMESV